MKSKISLILGLSCSLLMCQNSFAAGYGTGTTSTSGLATSYAGSATGMHDASDMFFNPAVLADSQKGEFILSVSYLDIQSDPDSVSASGGVTGAGVSDAGQNATIPSLYLAAPISDDTTFGFAVTTPFGLATKHGDSWTGRYISTEASIETYNFNPSISHKLSDKLSVGAGIQAQYIKAALTKMVSAGGDRFGKVQGNDWGYGYNLGISYQHSDNLKFGAGYRSKIDHKIEGTSRVLALGLHSNVDAKTATPESLTVGTSYKLTDKTDIAYDMTWTRWSRVQSIIINAHHNAALNDRVDYNMHDSFMHSIGGNHKVNNNFTLRSGVAYEKGAVTDANRHPSIPNGDKIWASLGFNYKLGNGLSLDAAYVHQFFRTATATVDAAGSVNSLSAKYKNKVDIYSLALRQEF